MITRIGVCCFTASARFRSSSSSGKGSGTCTVGSQPVSALVRKDARALRVVVGQRRVEFLHRQADLQVGDDERRGHNLEPEHARRCRLLDPRTRERALPLFPQVRSDAPQHFREIRSGAAARIEHVDVLRRESVRYTEVVLQRPVDAGHHVAHHFRGVYQTPSCLRRSGSNA